MIAAIVQARMGSTRLPGKTLMDIAGRPMLARLVARTRRIPGLQRVIIATTDRPADQAILRFAASEDLPAFVGSENDVLDRVYRTARQHGVSVIVRVSPDCPLLDPGVSGAVLARFLDARGAFDYVSNTQPPTYPDGLDTEVFSFVALERAWREARLASDREHVTPYIYGRGEFRLDNVSHAHDLSGLRWTVDVEEDLEFVRAVHARLGAMGDTFGMEDVLELLRREPALEAINRGPARNEGYTRSLREDPVVGERRG